MSHLPSSLLSMLGILPASPAPPSPHMQVATKAALLCTNLNIDWSESGEEAGDGAAQDDVLHGDGDPRARPAPVLPAGLHQARHKSFPKGGSDAGTQQKHDFW